MKKIERIEPTIPQIIQKKKVAAYARVSAASDRLNHSLSAQISYYNHLIQKNSEWEYAGVYADSFISGTSIKKRPEFQQMIADCEAGKINLILTKSISRFARNTVDLLSTVRHLKAIGVEVRFEKENISSTSSSGEIMLSILASFAQEESINISNNVKWGVRKRFEQGIPHGHFQVYGYRWEGNQLVIVPDEAAVVKRIFQNFLDGKSRWETKKEFAAEGITTRAGNKWVDYTIKQVLTNIIYTGTLMMQKYYAENPLSHKLVKNAGELPKYIVDNHHEAIIDKETFCYVQQEMARRKALGPLANKSINKSCFTTKIKCPVCGCNYERHTRKEGKSKAYWVCGSIHKKGIKCSVGGTINHEGLKRVCAKVLGLDEFDEKTFTERVEMLMVPSRNIIEFHMKDGSIITESCPNTGRKDRWTDEERARFSEWRKNHPEGKGATIFTGKIKCIKCGCNFKKRTRPSQLLPEGKALYWCCSEKTKCDTIGLREDLLKPFIAEVLSIPEFDELIFKQEIERIEVISATELAFVFYNGKRIERTWKIPKRVGKPWTDEQRAKIMASCKTRYTPEVRKRMGESIRRAYARKRAEKWQKQ